jgi:hypothetical protein
MSLFAERRSVAAEQVNPANSLQRQVCCGTLDGKKNKRMDGIINRAETKRPLLLMGALLLDVTGRFITRKGFLRSQIIRPSSPKLPSWEAT